MDISSSNVSTIIALQANGERMSFENSHAVAVSEGENETNCIGSNNFVWNILYACINNSLNAVENLLNS
jgi:hypothetical protein